MRGQGSKPETRGQTGYRTKPPIASRLGRRGGRWSRGSARCGRGGGRRRGGGGAALHAQGFAAPQALGFGVRNAYADTENDRTNGQQ